MKKNTACVQNTKILNFSENKNSEAKNFIERYYKLSAENASWSVMFPFPTLNF
jgi:hypothetical protein